MSILRTGSILRVYTVIYPLDYKRHGHIVDDVRALYLFTVIADLFPPHRKCTILWCAFLVAIKLSTPDVLRR
jgi:hypothetical protein